VRKESNSIISINHHTSKMNKGKRNKHRLCKKYRRKTTKGQELG
jgi:hypothetical protein